jgi:hypothetical protein
VHINISYGCPFPQNIDVSLVAGRVDALLAFDFNPSFNKPSDRRHVQF